MKDLLSDEVDDLNLEYRCDVGFRNFLRMKNSEFENILRMSIEIMLNRIMKRLFYDQSCYTVTYYY